MGLPGWLCFRIARRMIRARRPGDAGANPASLRKADYEEHRAATLVKEYKTYFRSTDLTNLDVLDFGCGHGGLCTYLANLGARGVTGIDLDSDRIESAKARARSLELAVQPRFLTASNEHAIDLPDDSVDVILCFDVLEHVMEYETIIREWSHVLRPGGRVLIHWVPWFNPYGPHINSLAPIPWAHVFFSERVLIDTCARIYDSPEFVPKHWDLDENGNKKPNKWRELDELPQVNRLTIARFERICRRVGLTIERAEMVGFGGSRAARCTRIFTRVPGL